MSASGKAPEIMLSEGLKELWGNNFSMTKNTNSLNVNIVTVRDGKAIVAYTYNKREEKEKPMALDVLMQAQSKLFRI